MYTIEEITEMAMEYMEEYDLLLPSNAEELATDVITANKFIGNNGVYSEETAQAIVEEMLEVARIATETILRECEGTLVN